MRNTSWLWLVLLVGCNDAASPPDTHSTLVALETTVDRLNLQLRDTWRAGQPVTVYMITLPDSIPVLIVRSLKR